MTRILALCLLAITGLGCAVHPTSITAEPDGVFISVNNNGVGMAPTSYIFDFGKADNYAVKGTKVGYFDAVLPVTSSTPLKDGSIHLALQQDASWTQTSTTDANNTWLRIQVANDMKPDVMWQKLIDTVTGRYSSLEQMDVASGYIRSVAVTRSYRHPTRGDFVIRTQLIGAIASREPLIYKVKILSERSDAPGQWNPYERVFKEDAQMVEELQTRLSVKQGAAPQ